MNSDDFSELLARNLVVEDVAALPALAAADVLAAANGGLQQFYQRAPSIMKRKTLSRTLRAPATVAVTFTAPYATTVSGTPFSTAQIGCTCRLSTLPVDNEVAGVSSVLDEYLSSTLAATATIYGDAVPLNEPIEKIGEVRLYAANCYRFPLYRDESLRQRITAQRETGEPRRFYLEPYGVSRGVSPMYLLRIWPAPLSDYTVRFEAEMGPVRLVLANLQATPVELPMEDALVEDILLPLAEARLLESPYWKDREKTELVQGRAKEALGKLELLPGDKAVPNHRILTPAGF